MRNVVVGDKPHPTIRPDQNLANATIAMVHLDPGLGLYSQHATNKIADEVAMSYYDLILVLSTSALKVSIEGSFGLLFVPRKILSRIIL